MASETIPLPDIEQSVTRPSVFQVIDQVRDILGITKPLEIIYAGQRGVVQATGSAISDIRYGNEAKFSSDDYIVIDVVEDYDTDAVNEIQSHSYDTAPIFADNKLGLTLRPIYIPSKMEISFTYQSTSETDVRQWIASQITKANRGRDTHLHHITYTYPLPFEFFIALDDVYKLREKNEGYGQTFMEYFDEHRAQRFTLLTNQEGGNPIPSIKERQGQIVGAFDFTVAPEKPEYVKEKGIWTTRFIYRYTYWRPDQCHITYPIAVHNEFMPERYLRYPEDVLDYDTPRAYFSHGMNAMQMFSVASPLTAQRSPTPYISIPRFDDFHPHVKEHTATIFTARCFLDDTKKDLLDLNELGDYELDKDILDFLKSEYRYLHKPFFSVFGVEHYINGELQNYDRIEVNDKLMVRSKEPLSMRDVHHVRLYGIPEINQSLYEALKRVSEHPKAFVKIVSAMNTLIAEDPDFNQIGNGKIMPWMFSSIYRILMMTHQGNLYSTGTNLDKLVSEAVFSDKNVLGLLTGLDYKTIVGYLETKRRLRFTVMNSAIIVHPRRELTN